MRRRAVVAGVGLLVIATAGAGMGVVASHTTAANMGVRTLSVGTAPWAIALDSRTGHAFVVNRATYSNGIPMGQGSVSVIDARRGTVLRTVPVGDDPRAVAVDTASNRVFITNDDDASVSVLDARSGALLPPIRVGMQPRAIAVNERSGRAFVVNTGEGTVSMIDTRRGAVLRVLRLGESYSVDSAAVDTRTNTVYIAGTTGYASTVSVLDGRSGALVRTLTVSGEIHHVAVDGRTGQIIVLGQQGLSVLDPSSGRVLRTIALAGRGGALAVDVSRQRIIVARMSPVASSGIPVGAGSVSVVDMRSGSVVRTVPVGVAPGGVAVDGRTGRAIVVNAGGLMPVNDPWGWLPSGLRHWLAFLPQQAPDPRTVPGSVSLVEAAP